MTLCLRGLAKLDDVQRLETEGTDDSRSHWRAEGSPLLPEKENSRHSSEELSARVLMAGSRA